MSYVHLLLHFLLSHLQSIQLLFFLLHFIVMYFILLNNALFYLILFFSILSFQFLLSECRCTLDCSKRPRRLNSPSLPVWYGWKLWKHCITMQDKKYFNCILFSPVSFIPFDLISFYLIFFFSSRTRGNNQHTVSIRRQLTAMRAYTVISLPSSYVLSYSDPKFWCAAFEYLNLLPSWLFLLFNSS